MPSRNLTRFIFRLHSIAGIGVGVLLVIISLSGVALLWEKELDPVFYPSLLQTPNATDRISKDSLFKAVLHKYPAAANVRLRQWHGESESHAVEFSMDTLSQKGTWQWVTAYVDPASGRILGARDANGSLSASIFRWLLRLHYSLRAGKPGEWLVAVSAILLLLAAFTGLILYRKHLLDVLLFKVRVNRKSRRTVFSSLHRIVGVWSTLFHLVIGVSALYMMAYVFAPDFYKPEVPEVYTMSTLPQHSIDACFRKLIIQAPDFQLVSIRLEDNGGLRFTGNCIGDGVLYGDWSTEATFDGNGILTELRSEHKKSLNARLGTILQTLHFGQWGGAWIKVIYTLLGLCPVLLSATGIYFWLRKRRHRRLQL